MFCFLFTSSLLNFKFPTPPHFLFSQFKAGKELKEKYYLIFLQVNPLIIYLHLFIVCGFFIKKKITTCFSFFFCKKKPFCNVIVGLAEPQGGFSESKDPQRVSEPPSQGVGDLRVWGSTIAPGSLGGPEVRGEEGELLYIPRGVGSPAPKDRSLGWCPQEAHPEDSGVSGHLGKPPAAIPSPSFPSRPRKSSQWVKDH